MITVIGCITQSNGIRYGQSNWPLPGNNTAPNCVFYNYLNNQFVVLADELLTGWTTPNPQWGGTIYSRAAHYITQDSRNPWKNPGDILCFAPLGMAAASSEVWRPNGVCYPRIENLRTSIHQYNPCWKVNAWLVMNGETDAADLTMPFGRHKSNFAEMICAMRQAGDTAPIFISNCTLCRNQVGANYENIDGALRRAKMRRAQQVKIEQIELVSELRHMNVHFGIDSDQITAEARWDLCHLGDVGQILAGEQLCDTLIEAVLNGTIC